MILPTTYQEPLLQTAQLRRRLAREAQNPPAEPARQGTRGLWLCTVRVLSTDPHPAFPAAPYEAAHTHQKSTDPVDRGHLQSATEGRDAQRAVQGGSPLTGQLLSEPMKPGRAQQWPQGPAPIPPQRLEGRPRRQLLMSARHEVRSQGRRRLLSYACGGGGSSCTRGGGLHFREQEEASVL